MKTIQTTFTLAEVSAFILSILIMIDLIFFNGSFFKELFITLGILFLTKGLKHVLRFNKTLKHIKHRMVMFGYFTISSSFLIYVILNF
ncbi:hypothetical protein IMZ31_22735 (plasmid) [Pontibacillus sp. ALD_SL1]|uniref:hypothetical protein n=1 Tax=Pontibacillus sp. ALD_SL1 TaxID=2777185 RepID=UPI001A96A45E|nr:hypothetical protein [Pontibacillus sp. ALD_SL1]QST02273.1 hypothetical protein IMZ31_22735 [Pontibacillus sp. ALD_SL1]